MSAPTTSRTTTSSSGSTGTGAQPMRAARERTGAGPIGWVGPLLALLLTLLGLVLLRDGIFAPPGADGAAGWPANQPSWTGSAVSGLDRLAPATWMIAVGVVMALVGLYLLVVALRRRTRRTIALRGVSGAHLTPSDVARRAASAAEDVDGVLHASASATRRKVTVSVTTAGRAQGTSAQVASAVTASLSALEQPPAVKVETSSDDSSKDLA